MFKCTPVAIRYINRPEIAIICILALNFKKAKNILESGLDFIIDDPELEINFNIQLGEAYNGLGDLKKKEYYFSKAEKALKNKN